MVVFIAEQDKVQVGEANQWVRDLGPGKKARSTATGEAKLKGVDYFCILKSVKPTF
jgi:hypothetical protein